MATSVSLTAPKRAGAFPDALYDQRAETATLASLLLDPHSAAPILSKLVTANDYNDSDLGKFVAATIQLHQAGRPVRDPIVLLADWQAMGLTGELTTQAGIARLLVNDSSSVSHTTYYAERVRDLSRLRKIVVLARQLEAKAATGKEQPEDLVGWMDSQALGIRHSATNDCQLIGEVMSTVIDDYEAKMIAGEKPALMSGFPRADENGFVFSPGELTVLAARTSMGKTTMATQIGMYHAAKGRSVMMATLEMKSTEVASRLLAVASGNNHQALRLGRVDEIAIKQMRDARAAIGSIPFRLWSPGRVKVGQIHAAASLAKASSKIELLIVDLLNVVKPDESKDAEHVALGKITKGIRDIAQQLQIPVILVAQLSRGAEGEPPNLKHLKGSGEIEQDADVIAFIHSKQRASPDVELIIAKNRFGTIGSVPLKFIANETRFADPSAEVRASSNYRSEFDSYNNSKGFDE